MTLQRQIGFWIACLAGLIAFLYLFSSVLTPFVAALILAYLLDPLVDWLERMKLGRLTATCLVLLLFVLLFVLTLLAVAPLMITQTTALIAKFPEYVTRLQTLVTEQGGPLFERFGGGDKLKEMQGQLAAGAGEGAKWLAGIVTDDEVILKLVDGPARDELIAEGGHPWVYSGQDKPMTMSSWIVVPERFYDDPEAFMTWAARAFELAPPKKAKPMKKGVVKVAPKKPAVVKAKARKKAIAAKKKQAAPKLPKRSRRLK